MTKPLSGFGPAKRGVLADEVADQLRNAIVTGDIESGTWLREDELATRMNVSRGPVREALVRLSQEGLVVVERHRGARVAEWYRKDIDQIFSLRRVLEELAADWACRNATEEDLQRIQHSLDTFRSTAKGQRTPELTANFDIEFHDALMQAAHHDRLYNAWLSLRSQVHSFLLTRMALRLDYLQSWEPDHRELLEHIRAGRSKEAVAHIGRHVSASYTRVVTAMERTE